MNYSSVIIKPLISEKSVQKAANFKKYTFLVNVLSSKTDIKLAFKKIFNVNVKSVQTSKAIVHRRRINFVDPRKGSNIKKTITYKKAIVTLADDEKLDYFEVE